jgi:hypothetical protein
MTFILINIRLEDGPIWYTSEQRIFLVNYRYERRFPFPGHRVPTTHYTHLYGFIQRRVTRADPPSPHLLSPHLRRNPLVGFRRCHSRRFLQQPPADTSVCRRNQRYASASRLQWIPQSALNSWNGTNLRNSLHMCQDGGKRDGKELDPPPAKRQRKS